MKTKNFNHEHNPLLELTSSSEDENDEQAQEIQKVTKKLNNQDSTPVVVMERGASVLSPNSRRYAEA